MVGTHEKNANLFGGKNTLSMMLKKKMFRKDLQELISYRKDLSILAGLSISLLTFTSVEALDIGQAKTQSFLLQARKESLYLATNYDVDHRQQ